MKKSINAWSVDKNTNFEDMFAELKAAGFEGVELNLDNEFKADAGAHSLAMDMTADDLAAIKALSDKYELPITSISTMNPLKGISGVREFWEPMKAVIFKQIEFAKALGAKGILTVPGGMHKGVSYREAHETSLEFYRSIKAEVEASGIIVGLENVWDLFFLSPFDAQRIIDAIDSPSIGMYFDVGNCVAYSNPEDWIDILGDRIKFVHVKDYLRNIRTLKGGAFVDVNNGSANWERVVEELQKAGFDGYLTAEVAKKDPEMSFTDFYKLVETQVGEIVALEKYYGA